MQVLLHTLNSSLYPDIEPPPTTWSGPDRRIVLVQCLLYASLAISLFAAFVAMLGKQWLDRFLRNKGTAATEKSWDRQRKLQGMSQWRFHIVMESLPILLQFALFLFGCSISLYLWTVNLVVAGVALAFTAFGVVFYCLITLAGTFVHNCPYHTPLSPIARTIAISLLPHVQRVITPVIGMFRRSLKPLTNIFRTTKLTLRFLRLPQFKFPGTLRAAIEREIPRMDLVRTDSGDPSPLFDATLVKWDQHRNDSSCVLWIMEASSDPDVLLFTFRFAAEIAWYPQIARSLCPHRVADFFFHCFLDGNIIPGMEERACYIASTLASILNIRACINQDLETIKVVGEQVLALNHRIHPDILVAWWSLLITFYDRVTDCPPLREDAPASFCIWLSQMVLQSVYWKQARAGECDISCYEGGFERLVMYRKAPPNAVILNLLLACAVSLGLRLNLQDLHMSDNSLVWWFFRFLRPSHYLWNHRNDSLHVALTKLNERMLAAIPHLLLDQGPIRVIMRLIRMWNNSGFQDFAKYCISWVEATLDCERKPRDRYLIGGAALCALDNHPSFSEAVGSISPTDDSCAEIALRYLSLYRYARGLDAVDPSPTYPAAAIVALQIIRVECSDVRRPMPKKRILGPSLVHVLTWAADKNPKNPVHFRPLALEIFTLIGGMWFDPWVDDISPEDKAQLVNALGNVLDTPNLTVKNRDPLTPWPPSECIDNYQEMFEGRTGSFVYRSSNVYIIPLLFGLCSSESWQESLKKSTFDFVSHKAFEPSNWAKWLRHTWKMIAKDSRLDIRLVVTKLKELERYDVLALLIRSIWLSPDPNMLPPHHWEWVERETLGLFEVQTSPGWRPLGGYPPTVSRTYIEFPWDDLYNSPSTAARYTFGYDGADGPIRGGRERGGWKGSELLRPKHWRVDQSCLLKRLCQFLAREMKLEGLHMFWEGKGNKLQGRQVRPVPNTHTGDPSYFVCDYP